MSIRQHFETALQGIMTEKDRAIATAKEKATREKIIPNNAGIDASRTDAINALNSKLNQDIAALQAKFNNEKQSIIEASEKKKTEFAEATIATETSIVAMQYDAAISSLKKQISEIKE